MSHGAHANDISERLPIYRQLKKTRFARAAPNIRSFYSQKPRFVSATVLTRRIFSNIWSNFGQLSPKTAFGMSSTEDLIKAILRTALKLLGLLMVK